MARRGAAAAALAGALAVLVTGALLAQPAPGQGPAPVATRTPATHFHHLHLNSTDPEAAIGFYTQHFASERAQFRGAAAEAGVPAVWTQRSWLLFEKVAQAPPSEIVSSIYHMGWGAEDMKAEARRQLEMGATLETPLTDAVDIFGAGVRDRNFFMYVASPEQALIEVQSAMHHNFMHVHMLSDDPVATAAWYEKTFGMERRRPANEQPRVFGGIPTGPSASLNLDNVTFIWYPTAHARAIYPKVWEGRTGYASPRGRVIDHVALSVDDLDGTIARLTAQGVGVIGAPQARVGGRLRSVFVQAPDNVEVELVEGHATRP